MRRVLFIFFAMVLFCVTMPVAAEWRVPPRIGVVMFPVSSQNPVDVKNASQIRLLISRSITAAESISVVDIDALDKFMNRNGISVHKLYSPSEMEKIPLRFVQYLVTGFVSVEKKSYRIKIYLLDLADKKFLFDEETRIDKNANLLWSGAKTLTDLTDNFIAKIRFAIPFYDRESEPVYRIGERGPAGGIVFFAKTAYTEGWRYLEAAPPETEFRAAWGMKVDDKIIPASLGTASVTGSGYDNTEIFAAHSSLRDARTGRSRFARTARSLAAMRCRVLDTGGYTDWYLPSKDELMYMYRNLARRGLGGFSGDAYWSSTESAYEYAYAQSFREGRQFFNGYKPMLLSVRAVRAF
jgi:hypothetical protein